MTKIIDDTNLGYLISKTKSAFWPKTDVISIGLDGTPTNNSSNLVTSGGVYSALENKYEKPSTGIPASDIASGVIPDSVTESTVSGWGFTKNTGTVTSVKVGTTSYNPSSGIVSLPAYPSVPSEMTASEATTGTSTTARTISASVLTSTIDTKITTMTQTEVDTIVNTIFS